jgi:gliding motility-associated-like protein
VFNNNTISVSGTYSDTLFTSQGCDSFVVLTLTVKSTPITNISDRICQGSTYTFNGNNLSQSGIYKDTLTTSSGCDSIISLDLTVNPLPQIIKVTSTDTNVLSGQTAQLNVEINESVLFNWSPANILNNAVIKNPVATPTSTTWMVVTVTNESTLCSSKDSIKIEFSALSCSKENVFIPNAFSPNGDTHNDTFIPRSLILKSMKLIVQDRWGNNVFESDDINVGWDGTYKGQPAPVEAYGYYFVGECLQGEKITIKGNVTLLR